MTVADDELDELVHRADLDGLVRLIDDRTSACDWDGLLRVRDRTRRAVDTGRQLWPAATLAEYRLSLLGSPESVAAVLDETDGMSGRFTIGPLTEVAAQNHTWAELAPVLDRGPRAAFVAHERTIRGEEIVDDGLPPVIDLPLELSSWEPDYPTATYSDAGIEAPPPDLPTRWSEIETEPTAERLDDDVELAFRQLVEPWSATSNGQVDVACVVGDAAHAIGVLGPRSARLTELDPPTALAWLGWAGASGGAHGRRRGAASGRFSAWWILAAFGDLLDEWPIAPERLGELAHDLRWYRWDAHEPELGWTIRLAVEDHSDDESIAWALSAVDMA